MPAMNTATTIKKLNEFGVQVKEKFTNINAGGCCVFAALVGAHLQQLFPKLEILVETATEPGISVLIEPASPC